MKELLILSLTVILDANAEVYRMGYGDAEALKIIRETSLNEIFDLHEQLGVRIGVVISDDHTMVYAPLSRDVAAGSTTEEITERDYAGWRNHREFGRGVSPKWKKT